jgi:hypothetical protein
MKSSREGMSLRHTVVAQSGHHIGCGVVRPSGEVKQASAAAASVVGLVRCLI